ncbi:PstS family phosphate ABC transporter substrate-binding protein [Merismopedia glauca]|uniref:Phosphate ABC transporter substrate-binding protein n=1 Tax=Merismopedia glauca CCAP 1448/3 TaxID=1296344 RepID=A0A2T1C163_9CYAN|nr:PstS family phosphate ABC transporter substrate-binding protein [Merismopedia glauca]PSB01918.1 phosphate ABC transporter substrate-binding protein [Merismopedia glauca CCAP 1448/3]
MSSNRESALLIVTLLATLGVVGGGLWWLKEHLTFVSEPIATSLSPNSTKINGNCQIANAPSGLFSYGGSTTWAVIRQKTEPIIAQICPAFRLRYTDPTSKPPGSQAGIEMLIDNQLAFSQSSNSLKPEDYQKAQAKGFSLKEVPVAIDGLVIAVHPQLQISGLSVGQLSDIYTGKVKNWNQLGGPNLKITPYSRTQESGGTVDFFSENVLQNQKFGSNVKYVYSTTPALRQVAADPGGIYYASASEIVHQCEIKPLPLFNNAQQLIPPYQEPFVPLSACPQQRNQINQIAFRIGTYPITRRLFVIVKLNSQVDEQAGDAYAQWLLTSQGQETLKKAGFIRLN